MDINLDGESICRELAFTVLPFLVLAGVISVFVAENSQTQSTILQFSGIILSALFVSTSFIWPRFNREVREIHNEAVEQVIEGPSEGYGRSELLASIEEAEKVCRILNRSIVLTLLLILAWFLTFYQIIPFNKISQGVLLSIALIVSANIGYLIYYLTGKLHNRTKNVQQYIQTRVPEADPVTREDDVTEEE